MGDYEDNVILWTSTSPHLKKQEEYVLTIFPLAIEEPSSETDPFEGDVYDYLE